MSDRFDLEQEIMECWKVVNDIGLYIEQGVASEDFRTLADYYERRFTNLWNIFETLCRNRQLDQKIPNEQID